jgi:hypothetical protein
VTITAKVATIALARKRRKVMSKQLTEEEQIALILGTIELGKRKEVKKNLRYVMTALGGTFVAVEQEDEDESN